MADPVPAIRRALISDRLYSGEALRESEENQRYGSVIRGASAIGFSCRYVERLLDYRIDDFVARSVCSKCCARYPKVSVRVQPIHAAALTK